jgi:ankyrin repeat protein
LPSPTLSPSSWMASDPQRLNPTGQGPTPSPLLYTLVQVLVQYGADVQLRDLDGRTPLFYAAAGGSLDTIKLLLAVS